MKVAIDINGALGTQGGIHVYIRELINQFPAIKSDLTFALYAAFWNGYPRKALNSIPTGANKYETIFKRLPQKYVDWLEWRCGIGIQERILKNHDVDLFHATGHILPRINTIKTLLTVHHENPRAYAMNQQELMDIEHAARSAGQADHVIAVSEHCKTYLINELRIPESKITVIYHGAPSIDLSRTDKKASLERLAQSYAVEGPFILSVAHINKRKNIEGLIKAHSIFTKHIQKEIPLIIIGNKNSPYMEDVMKTIRENHSENAVKFMGEMPHSSVLDFYLNALMFVSSTWIESFGIPMIEAMKCGCPVIASNVDAIPEIVGDGGILVSPHDLEAIASAMVRVYSDAALRKDLIHKGSKRASLFTWNRAAQETLSLYQKLLSA